MISELLSLSIKYSFSEATIKDESLEIPKKLIEVLQNAGFTMEKILNNESF